jgi:rSAM/selenodomain-associated transferase 1
MGSPVCTCQPECLVRPKAPGVLGVFAKYWQPGEVKTRLAQDVGDDRASQLQRSFLDAVLSRCRSLAEYTQLWYTPARRSAEFGELAGPGWTLHYQGDGDLGRRLERFFDSALSAGPRAVAIGSDSPNLPREFIDRAFDALERFPVVLGECDDGGYYLIGMAGRTWPLLAGIAWGEPIVWRQTIERLESLRLPFARLPSWYDVDRIADLRRLAADLAAATEPDLIPLREAVLAALGKGPCESTTV